MQVKTYVKAGGIIENHNETLVRSPRLTTGLTVKTRVKAGSPREQHNEMLVRTQGPRLVTGLRVKTQVKAGVVFAIEGGQVLPPF